MKVYSFSLLFLCLFSGHLLSQAQLQQAIDAYSKAYELYEDGQYKEALPHIQVAQSASQDLDTLYGESIHLEALVHDRMGKYDLAEPLYKKTLEVVAKQLGDNHPSYAKICYDVGFFYKNKGDFKLAEQFQKQGVAIYKENGQEDSADYGSAIGGLAAVYMTFQRNYKALPLFLESLSVIKKHLGKQNGQYATGLNNLAILYKHIKEYDKAEALYKESIEIRKKLYGPEHPNVATAMGNLAIVYKYQRKYDLAEKLLLKVVKIRKKALGEKHPNYLLTVNNLAKQYKEAGVYHKAIPLYRESVQGREESLGKQHPHTINTLNDLSDLYYTMGVAEPSLSYAIKALSYNSKNQIDTLELKNNLLEYIDPEYYYSHYNTMNSLFLLSFVRLLEYSNSQDSSYLVSGFHILKKLAQYVQKAQHQFARQSDKLHSLKRLALYSDRAIQIALKYYKVTNDATILEEVIGLAEQNKSALLSSTLTSDNALAFGNVPDSLINLEQSIKKQLAKLQKDLRQATTKKDSVLLHHTNQALIATQIQQDSILHILQNQYPKYNQLKYNITTLTSAEVQEKLLDDKTALIEYFSYSKRLFIIVITKESTQVYKCGIASKQVKELVHQLRTALSNYRDIADNPNKNYTNYTMAAYELYKEVLGPFIEEFDSMNINKLIIVPDRDLSYIPFETLLRTEPIQSTDIEYRDLDYLMNDFVINYSFSASLLLENLQTSSPNQASILAFASHYNAKDSLQTQERSDYHQRLRKVLHPLPAAQMEVNSLEKLFPYGNFYYKQDANEQSFKTQAANYAILHLAMHGVLDAENPLRSSLVFSENGDKLDDNFLEAHEISHLDLNNQLVVLSACETGYGKFEQSEGIQSLARSFMYAGVPSLVVSLWQVNDASTALIMQQFYKALLEDMPKDEALRQAKKNYLMQASGIAKHPAFWSPFIQIGNPKAIQFSSKMPYLWWGIGILTLLLLVIIGVRKASNPS